jgi:hypothetical protein
LIINFIYIYFLQYVEGIHLLRGHVNALRLKNGI